MTTAIEAAVEALGITLVSNNGKNAKGYCPVHKERTGHDDTHPSWSINVNTGAWRCFSCGGVGALGHLVEAMGGNYDGIGDLIVQVSVERARKFDDDDEAAPEKPIEYVSERLFAKNPYPHESALERRDLDIDTAKLLNIRWDRKGMCYLLPMYSFDGVLLGWQEKSAGYFNNYPEGLRKAHSLFGYQAVRQAKRVVLVESQLDAARFWRYGIESVAQMGSALSVEQAHALEALDPGVVIIAMDHDKAGHAAAATASRRLSQCSVDVGYFTYTKRALKLDRPDPGDLDSADLIEGVEHASLWAPPWIAEEIEKQKWHGQRSG
jgi:5S rRNA maturation endonuclease (ribonuclease M5)